MSARKTSTAKQILKEEKAVAKEKVVKKRPHVGRGGETSGWRAQAPHSINPRRKLMERCGEGAFLEPKKLKFPIVPAKSKVCKPSCKGIESALVRAKQNKHPSAAKKAEELLEKLNCPARRPKAPRKK